VLYAAGTGGGVFKSSDGGEMWTPGERLVPPSCSFSGLVIDAEDNDTVYAASPCAGVFKSTDASISWVRASDSIEGGVNLLIQSPHAPGLLLAAGHDGQAYRSRDRAVTWESISDGLPSQPIRGLAVSAADTYWATTDDGRDGTLYRFGNGTWSAVPLGQSLNAEPTNILVDLKDPTILYVGLEDAQQMGPGASLNPDVAYLFRSTDAGFSWNPLQPQATLSETGDVEIETRVYLLGKGGQSGVLYIATESGLLASPDGGDSWQRIELPQEILSSGDPRQIAVDSTDNNVLYLPLRGAGVAKSVDGGRTWQSVNSGLNNMVVGAVTTHSTDPATLYAVPSGAVNVFKSTDYGQSWVRLNDDDLEHPNPRQIDDLVLDPARPDSVYRVVSGARVLRSDDGGDSWFLPWPAFRFSSIYALAASHSDPNVLYAHRSGMGLWRSDDDGNTWHFLTGSGVDYTYALAIHPDNPGFVLSGENRKPYESAVELHRSKDGGETWDVALEVPDATGISSVAFDPRVEPFFAPGKRPDDPTRLYAASVGLQGRLWYSNDAGDSWKLLNDDLSFTNVRAMALAPHRPGVAFAGVWGGGTWRTEDGGQSWQRLPGDPATSAVAIAVDPSNHNVIYIADGTTPHLYRSTDDGNTWELLFAAGADYDRMAALALAPSDPSILYVSAVKITGVPVMGAIFRIDANAPIGENANDITNNLPAPVDSLAVHRRDPGHIFAALDGAGVWKTVDDGASWRQVKSGLPEASFFQIVVDPIFPETLFLVGGHDVPPETGERAGLDLNELYGIWKSTDDGNTWAKVGDAVFGRASGPIKAVAFHPDDQQVMYAAGEGGVYLSPDRGQTWTGINGRLPFSPMNAVATDGQTLYAGSAGGGVFAGAIHPLIHTADWSPESHLAVPIAHIEITLHPQDPQTLYASAYPGGVFKTTDGGNTWHARNFGLPSYAVADPTRQGTYALAIAPNAPEVLYVGLYHQGVYRSDDDGFIWRSVHGEARELLGAGVQTLLIHPDDANVVYVATEDGVWRTVNGGRNWESFDEGLPPTADVRTLALGSGGELYAGSRGYGLFTRDAQQQVVDGAWRQLPALDLTKGPSASLLIHPGDPNTLYAATFPGGVFKTTDGGTGWRERNVGLENGGVFALTAHPNDAQTLYAGTTDGIARSIDGGATWHPWDAGWPPRQWVLSIAIDPTNTDRLYACSKSDAGVDGLGGTVMTSTDGGTTWSEITLGLDVSQAFYKVLLDRFDPNIIYLATEREGIYISRDNGVTWSTWNEGLWSRVPGGNPYNTAHVLQLSADGRLLYFGSAGSGVWRRPAEGAP